MHCRLLNMLLTIKEKFSGPGENDFFGFPKLEWLHVTREVDKSVRPSPQIFSGFNVPKIIKIG